jgi:tetratricopeptide (TPR) repeat protein
MNALVAQSKADLRDLEKAGNLYLNGQYSDALYYLDRIPSSSKIMTKSYKLSALCHANMGNYEKALTYSQLAMKVDSSKEIKILYAENLMHCDEFEKAYEILKNPLLYSYFKTKKNILDSAILWKKNQTLKIQNHLANSKSSDISAIEYQNQLLFSSNTEGVLIKRKNQTDGEPYYNFVIASASGKHKLFSEKINSGEHDFAPSLTHHEDTLYFTRRKSEIVDGKQLYYFKLYCSEKKKNSWTPAYQFILNDSASSYAYPFLDEKNKIFYFCSDMPGGYGGWDIYICIKEDSLWSEPINLGPTINTNKNEIYPVIYKNTLYFSSNGHFSLGGFDIVKSVFQKGKWSSPENLKTPINSGADDVAISFSKTSDKAWFISNRRGGKGQEDIYEIMNRDALFSDNH